MNFYDREVELDALAEIAKRAGRTACFTVMTGCRRVGKTALILKALAKTRCLYLFVCDAVE